MPSPLLIRLTTLVTKLGEEKLVASVTVSMGKEGDLSKLDVDRRPIVTKFKKNLNFFY
jgi:hypothetical protein